VRVLDALDFSQFVQSPKWICGYSDITVLHAHVNQSLGISSIHSTMPVSFSHATPEALQNLMWALKGQLECIEWKSEMSSQLSAEGAVVGGNLSVLYSLLGSKQSLAARDKIVFLEDVDEMLYHMDRMMMALLRSGALEGAKAIVCGGFTQMKDNTREFGFDLENPWGRSVEEIMRDVAHRLQIPVVFDFPAGHQNDNRAFYLGVRAALRNNNGSMQLVFQTHSHQ
jgi:muramoyltetrapeptide carboxypeptidase